jgi:two-component system, response regulator
VPKIDVQKQFGTSVRAWRGRLGLSQEELAERAGLHRTYVCDIERGARNVSLKSIEKLAGALNISASVLFNGVTDPSQDKSSSRPLFTSNAVEILFVEDEPGDIEVTARVLRNAKFANRIHVVRDGAAALDFLFNTEENSHAAVTNRPHMVLLDLNLPKVSGLEVLRRIKSDSRTRSIPVVVLTESKFDRDIATSKKLGADAHIVKPVTFTNLSEAAARLSLQWMLLKP